MDNKEQDYKVTNGNFFVIASVIVFVFFLIITIINLDYFVNLRNNNDYTNIESKLFNMDAEKQKNVSTTCFLVTSKESPQAIKIIEEGLEKSKIGFSKRENLYDITDSEMAETDIIIINGSSFEDSRNMDFITKCLAEGKHIVFTSVPDIEFINKSGLDKIMGIKEISQAGEKQGANFLPGFMLGGLLELKELKYEAAQIQLLSTTKTYVTDGDDLPIIWRNIYNNSQIYVVNGPFFQMNAGYGILSSILSEIYPDYIYPVINAKVFTYTGIPYINNENTDNLKKIYNRDALQLQKDLLIPNILSITKSRKLIPSPFLVGSFSKDNESENFDDSLIKTYKDDMYKLGREVGMSYSGDFQKDREAYGKISPNSSIKAMILNEEELPDLKTLSGSENNLETVVGPWQPENENFGFINNKTVYIPVTIDGTTNSDLDKLSVYSGLTAFGTVVHNLDFENIILPENDGDNWIDISKEYIKTIDSYIGNFKVIKARNIIETSNSVKRFNVNEPTIAYSKDGIKLSFENWYGESYYILRTSKEIESIVGGTVEQMESNAYMITVNSKEVDIKLKQNDKYE